MPERRAKTERETKLSPQERTDGLFGQGVERLARALRGRIIVSQDDGKMIRIDETEAWHRENVGRRYHEGNKNLNLREMEPGLLGIFPLPVRRMRQSLVSAKDYGRSGACVRLLRASKYDEQERDFIEMPREGDIANLFDFDDNEAVRLRFVDDSEILYFSRGAEKDFTVGAMPETGGTQTERANRYLRNLVQ